MIAHTSTAKPVFQMGTAPLIASPETAKQPNEAVHPPQGAEMLNAILCFFWEPWDYSGGALDITRTCARCQRRERFAYGMWHRI